MANSTTRKFNEFDLEKIRRFTENELVRISGSSRELPFCYQIGSDVLVGNYSVTFIQHTMEECAQSRHLKDQILV